MPAEYVTSIIEGQDFYVVDLNPNAVVTAKRGSLALRQDDGNVTVYVNTTAGATGVGSTWVVLMQTGWAGISQLLLADNSAAALQIGSTGFLDLLKFVTTNGAEQIVMRSSAAAVQISGNNGLNLSGASAQITSTSSALLDVGSNATSVSASTSGVAATVYKNFTVPANGTGGTVDTAFVLTNQRNLQLVDAWIVSGGAGGGGQYVEVRNNALSVVTGQMVPGAAGVLTRNGAYTSGNATFTPGQTLYTRTAGGTVASVLHVLFAVA
jgi:hypothetical protein